MLALTKVAFVLSLLVLLLVPAHAIPLAPAHKRCVRRSHASISPPAQPTHTAEVSETQNLIATGTTSATEPSSTAGDDSDKANNGSEDSKDSKNEDKNGSESDNSGSDSGSTSALFPVGRGSKSWTTCSKLDGSRGLSNNVLSPFKEMKSLSHDIVDAPDGSKGMEAFYPKGSMNPGHNPQGGFSFYAAGPDDVDITTASEVTFGYSVYFADGFDWVKGGKLPGIYGGNSAEAAVSCSGGRRDDACFSARLMWRSGGEGEFYTYLPPSFDANKGVCNAPNSHCNSVYGASVGRGTFTFKSGQWNTVAERVKLNDAGKSNGELELFFNGKSVVKVDGLVLRDSGAGKFRGMQMQTFFGGSHDGFQAHKDEKVWFKDFSLAITETL